ncbi:uncharacterized protein FFMR_09003 [Fusarium fujikuroi]|nr:uncharacterized protein FFMR_09003 [Fusarium fujikuroi]
MSPITDFFAFTNNMWSFGGRSTEPVVDDTMAQEQPTQQMEMGQPKALQPMDSQQPHTDTQVSMRGGHRGGGCPGRCCMCIPCPCACDFCVF